jgi:hypothetical protein
VSNVLDRPRVPSPRSAAARPEPIASVWLRGAFAATWAVVVGVASLIVIALVVWAADSESVATAGGAMRFAAQLWLLAQRTPLRLAGGGALAIPPLALTVGVGALLARATAIVARSTACSDGRGLSVIVASVAAPYAVLATVLAAMTASAAMRPSVGAAFVCALLVGGVSSAIGALRGAGLIRSTWRSLPRDVRGSLEAAGSATVVLLGAATLLAVGSLLAHAHQFGSLVGSYHSGSGEFAMVLLSLLMLPNAAVFAVGYVAGPGFAIGAGTSVTYGGSHLGAVPAFPLVVAAPSGAAPWQILTICVLALLATGVVAGVRVARPAESSLKDQLRRGLGAAAAVGLGAAVLVGYAGGPAGPGRLSAVGPSPWQVGLAVAGEIAVVSSVTVLVLATAAGERLRERAAAGVRRRPRP